MGTRKRHDHGRRVAQQRHSLCRRRPAGAHLCLFYETQDDLIDAATRFFGPGLDGNELCVWAVPDRLAPAAAAARLRAGIAGFDDHVAAGRMRLFTGTDWYSDGEPDAIARAAFWSDLIARALAEGYAGLRASGDALWLGGRERDVLPYERAVGRVAAGRPLLALCTYDLTMSRGVDVLDIARLHSVAVVRRRGDWQLFEAPALKAPAGPDTDALARAGAFPGHEQLTERERVVLSLLLKGVSSKEVARDLGISPRTAEFHRANIIGKLGARNTTDLARRVFRGG